MTHTTTPRPIVAMPATSTYLRALSETCTNSLEARDRARSVTLEAVPLPDGTLATIRCTRGRGGAIRVAIVFKPQRLAPVVDAAALELDR